MFELFFNYMHCFAGGNDIALHPSVKTGLSVASLVSQPSSWIESGSALGLGHMVNVSMQTMANAFHDWL